MSELRVATEFSPYLGGRYEGDGPWSGEEFRNKHLGPKVKEAIRTHTVVHVMFDGVAGMPTSFLEEAFGGLVRTIQQSDRAKVIKALQLHASDPELWPFVRLAEKFMEQQLGRPN